MLEASITKVFGPNLPRTVIHPEVSCVSPGKYCHSTFK